ncbi:unnamed protein product [Victoria cruziana]
MVVFLLRVMDDRRQRMERKSRGRTDRRLEGGEAERFERERERCQVVFDDRVTQRCNVRRRPSVAEVVASQ